MYYAKYRNKVQTHKPQQQQRWLTDLELSISRTEYLTDTEDQLTLSTESAYLELCVRIKNISHIKQNKDLCNVYILSPSKLFEPDSKAANMGSYCKLIIALHCDLINI